MSLHWLLASRASSNLMKENKVAACGDLLKEADFKDSDQRQKLRNLVSAPDEYIMLRRVLGIYPLTSLFVSHGVSKWHADAHKSFSNEPPVNWQTIRYVPGQKIDGGSVRQIVAQPQRDSLGIPVYSPEQLEALFRIYAPVWEIQHQADDDRIGTPYWTGKGVLDVDTHKPLTYTLLSYTHFEKQILAQLNYIIWFPARSKQSDWDLYGGLLDGLIYRVTLDSSGAPLIYETVHNCGYHYRAYPTRRLQVRAEIDYAEPPLVLKAPDLNSSKDFITIARENRTHTVQHLYPRSREHQSDGTAYSLADYGQLRSLPYSSVHRRSMFDQYSFAAYAFKFSGSRQEWTCLSAKNRHKNQVDPGSSWRSISWARRSQKSGIWPTHRFALRCRPIMYTSFCSPGVPFFSCCG